MDCPKCGKSHDSEQGMKIHYGRSHEGSIAGTEVECHKCGDSFRVDTYRIEKGVRHFCSQECRSKVYSNKVEVDCDWCGDSFRRTPSKVEVAEKHYCSTECKGKAYRDRVEVECANCGAQFKRGRAFVERTDVQYCGNECRHEHQRGAAHPSYNGAEGLGAALRKDIGGRRWKPLRQEIHSDNDVVCEWCGDGPFEDGRKIDLHHIVPLMAGGTNTMELIMPLCVGCHRRAEVYTQRILEHPIADTIAEHAD